MRWRWGRGPHGDHRCTSRAHGHRDHRTPRAHGHGDRCTPRAHPLSSRASRRAGAIRGTVARRICAGACRRARGDLRGRSHAADRPAPTRGHDVRGIRGAIRTGVHGGTVRRSGAGHRQPHVHLYQRLLSRAHTEGQADQSDRADLERTEHRDSARLHQPHPAYLSAHPGLLGAQRGKAHQRSGKDLGGLVPRAGAGRSRYPGPGPTGHPGHGEHIRRLRRGCAPGPRGAGPMGHGQRLGELLPDTDRRGAGGRPDHSRCHRRQPGTQSKLVCRCRPVVLREQAPAQRRRFRRTSRSGRTEAP